MTIVTLHGAAAVHSWPSRAAAAEAEQGLVPVGVALEHLRTAALSDPRLVAVLVIVVVADDVDQVLAPQRV
jgi:hypothetical protein